MVPAKVTGSSVKALEMLWAPQVSRDLQKPQRHSAKATVTNRQLHRVATWQHREAVTAKFTFVTQRITKSVIYRVSLHFASVSHLWVTNLRSCQLKGNFQAYFRPITAPPSPLLLPSLSERRTRVQRPFSSLPTYLHTFFLLIFFLCRIAVFPYTEYNIFQVTSSCLITTRKPALSCLPFFPHDRFCFLTGFTPAFDCTHFPLPCLVCFHFSVPAVSLHLPRQEPSAPHPDICLLYTSTVTYFSFSSMATVSPPLPSLTQWCWHCSSFPFWFSALLHATGDIIVLPCER